jgi:hypothetical protein
MADNDAAIQPPRAWRGQPQSFPGNVVSGDLVETSFTLAK